MLLGGAEVYLGPDQLLRSGNIEIRNFPAKDLPKNTAVTKHKIMSFPENLQEKMILDRLDQLQDINSLTDVCSGNLGALIELLCKMEVEGKVVVSGQVVRRVM